MPEQRRCEKAEDCLLAKMIQEVYGCPGQRTGMIPIGASTGLLQRLRDSFTDLQCHLGTALSVPSSGEPSVGILCIGGRDGSCIRLLLTEEEVAGLQKVLAEMQEAMLSFRGAKGQVH